MKMITTILISLLVSHVSHASGDLHMQPINGLVKSAVEAINKDKHESELDMDFSEVCEIYFKATLAKDGTCYQVIKLKK